MRRNNHKSSFGYLLPFLILVGFGVIAVLSFQLWSNVQKVQGDAIFYIARGKAKILLSSQGEWENAFSGTNLLIGDSLKTSSDGRLVLQFFNGTKIRLAEDTQIKLIDVTKNADNEKIVLALEHGEAWFNKVRSENVEDSSLEVQTPHMDVKDTGTIFDVEKRSTEAVRVLKGSVMLDIYPDTKNKLNVSQDVGVGQEIELDGALLKALQNHESPSLLLEIREEFKGTEWYAWNMSEDTNPTDFSQMPSGSSSSVENPTQTQFLTQPLSSSSLQNSTLEPVTTSASVSELDVPVIESPASSEMTTEEKKMTISGKVPEGTHKIVVKQRIGGKDDQYTLGKFKAGQTSFSYNVSELLGNYRPGENIYRFYAVDKDGHQGEPASITINYTKKAPEITEALTDPVVKTFNGSTSSVVTKGVRVEGEIHGAEKVVVNDYTLSKFEPGSTKWSYYADESQGNLKPGLNEFEVYGIGSDGKKSGKVKFSVTYNKPEPPPVPKTQENSTSESVSKPTSETVPPVQSSSVPVSGGTHDF